MIVSPFGSSTIDGSYGLSVWAAVVPSFVEFWEAVETGVASGTYGTSVMVGPAVPSVPDDWTTYRNVAPNDGLRRQIKARHVRDGATTSGFTSVVTVAPWGAPAKLPLSPPTRTIPYADDANFAATSDASGQVFLNGAGTSSTQKVNVGTTSTPASMQRIYRVPFTAFVPDSSVAYTYDRSGYLRATGSTGINFYAPLVLPQGSTIISMAFRAFKTAAGDGVTVALWRVSDGVFTSLSSASLSATGAFTTVSGSGVSEAVNTSYAYVIQVNAVPASIGNNPGLSYVELVATVPDLNTGL